MIPADQRITQAVAATLSWQPVDSDGEPHDPGTVTIGVTKADGTELIAAGTATTAASATGPRTKALTAAQTATLDRLTATWKVSPTTVQTTTIDIAGRPYFSNAELRLAEPALSDTNVYTAAVISRARLEVETFFESVCNRAFVPRYHYATLPGYGRSGLVLDYPDLRTVRSAAMYGDITSTALATLTAAELAAIPRDPAGIATRWSGVWTDTVIIGYEHGLDLPPADVKRQAMILTREVLVASKSAIPQNATNFTSSELGWSAVLVTPGIRGAHTAVSSVNECLDRWTVQRFGVA